MGPARDIPALVAALTLDEKASLTAGIDFWHTAAIPRLGIPSVKFTDGPNGARGETDSFLSVTPSICIPSATALGATWDPALVAEASAAVARQARDKGAPGAAGPHRQPAPAPALGAQLRGLLRGPVAHRQAGRRLHPGRPGPGRHRDRQAPRRQRDRVRALHQLVRDRRAHPARALPAPLRARGQGGGGAGAHDQLQPGQRRARARHPAPPARHRPRGVGLRRLRHDRLVRLGRHRRRRPCRAGSGDARDPPAPSVRRWPRRSARGWSTRPSWTPRSGGCSPSSTGSAPSTTRRRDEQPGRPARGSRR